MISGLGFGIANLPAEENPVETFSKAAKAFKMAHVSSAEPFIMAMGSLNASK